MLDPCNEIARCSKGEPSDKSHRDKERKASDELRLMLCESMRSHKDRVASLLHDACEVDNYIASMSNCRTWGDEICLTFLPDIVQCPIQVFSWNAVLRSVYDAGMFLPTNREMHKNECIVLFYNGKSHYDLVSTRWLLEREAELS
mgnify:CR=1 FL=1